MKELYLDVDGVILDFEGSFVDFIREEYITDLPLDYSLQTWEMTEEFKSLDIEEVWERFVNSDRFTRLELLVDSDSFNKLSTKFPIYFITNIPLAQFSSREQNLKYHNLNYKELHLAGHFNFGEEDYPSKADVIKKLHNPGTDIIFLDDHPKNCMEIKRELPESKVYLMNRPHNLKASDPSWVRVENWNDFLEQIVS
ncbi:hypothetical protein KJ966_25765 [bacterium]|nr:hypothetical protein [bacterium]